MFEKLLPYIGGIGIIIAAVLTWMSAKQKTGVDESGIVFAQWEKLMASHKEDMRILKAEFVEYKQSSERKSELRNDEIESLRKRLSDVEDRFAAFRRESDERIRALDAENRGLRRQISQVAVSTHAEVLKIALQSDATDITVEAHDESNTVDHEGMRVAMEKLSGMGDNSRHRIDEEDGA